MIVNTVHKKVDEHCSILTAASFIITTMKVTTTSWSMLHKASNIRFPENPQEKEQEHRWIYTFRWQPHYCLLGLGNWLVTVLITTVSSSHHHDPFQQESFWVDGLTCIFSFLSSHLLMFSCWFKRGNTPKQFHWWAICDYYSRFSLWSGLLWTAGNMHCNN